MAITASDKGGSNYPLAPEGNHVGICVQVIDLGTQEGEYLGKLKASRKVRVAWELPEEKYVFDETRGEESFMVSKEYTLSLHEKANLRHDLESWRGHAFTEEELAGFDIAKLLGAAAMVNVVHETSQNNRKYVKITSVTRLPKSIKIVDVPKPTLPLLEYAIDDKQNEVFEALPQFVRDKILASEEATGNFKVPESKTPGAKQQEEEDDIPPF